MASPTNLRSTLTAFERRYRHDHEREHAILIDAAGSVITENIGDYDSVHFDERDLERAVGGLISHSHPRCLPPSGADLTLAAQYGLTLRAFGTAPDSGQQFDYTVQFADPNKQLAVSIASVFDDEVERAEKELAKLPLGDLGWQRESRHLALIRLAKRFDFIYRRVQLGAALSESKAHEKKRLDVLAQVRPTLTTMVWRPLAADIHRLLIKASVNGSIPVANLAVVRSGISALVQKTMLGEPTRLGALEPYTVRHGEVIARSRYFAALLTMCKVSAALAVDYHAGIMRKYLPSDLIRDFSYAAVSPSDVAEADDPQADPLHLWLGEDGKRLLDRIWNAAGDLRRRLDENVTQAIVRLLPTEAIAGQLESYLIDGVGGYEGLRLARTEISAAHSRAGFLAGLRNPFVEKYQPFTAPEHKCCDECDLEEQNGPYNMDDPMHLPPFHGNCICGVMFIIVKNVKSVVVKLREQISKAVAASQTAVTDILGPLSRSFLAWLFRGRS